MEEKTNSGRTFRRLVVTELFCPCLVVPLLAMLVTAVMYRSCLIYDMLFLDPAVSMFLFVSGCDFFCLWKTD